MEGSEGVWVRERAWSRELGTGGVLGYQIWASPCKQQVPTAPRQEARPGSSAHCLRPQVTPPQLSVVPSQWELRSQRSGQRQHTEPLWLFLCLETAGTCHCFRGAMQSLPALHKMIFWPDVSLCFKKGELQKVLVSLLEKGTRL